MNYKTPIILKVTPIEMAGTILAASVMDDSTVETTGQEVVNYDFSGQAFNHEWK